MEQIIKEILGIDGAAKEKIAQAELKRNQIIAEAFSVERSMLRDSINEAERKIARIEEAEKAKTKEKLAAVKKERDAELKRLDAVYKKRAAQWENEIFESIINGVAL